MFPKLAARLTALAMAIAALVVGSVTLALAVGISLVSAISTRDVVNDAAREAPEVARIYLGRDGSLERARPDITRVLERPGVRVFIGFARPAQEAPPGFGTLFAERQPGEAPDPGAILGAPSVPPPATGTPSLPTPPWPTSLARMLNVHRAVIVTEGIRIVILPDVFFLFGTLGTLLRVMLAVGAIAVVASYFVGRYIAAQALRPLVETTNALSAFAEGDFTPRFVTTDSRSELGALARAFNGAVAQVTHALAQRAIAEAQMRQFIADAGHELRTPLTVIMGFIDVMRRRTGGDPARTAQFLETMMGESRRMRALIERLIELARLDHPPDADLERVDLVAVAQAVVAPHQLIDPERFRVKGPQALTVRARELDVHHALRNIVDNAVKYAGDGPIEISVENGSGGGAVTVTDHGPGISPEDRAHVFDRFYRGAGRGGASGFGLGLAIAKRAVERSGGTIALAEAHGSGCSFRVSFPLDNGG